MTHPEWPRWMPPRFSVRLGRDLADPETVTADVVSIRTPLQTSAQWQDEVYFSDRIDYHRYRLAVRPTEDLEPTSEDLDWLSAVPGYDVASLPGVAWDRERDQRKPQYPPIVAMWIGDRHGLAFTNNGDEIRMGHVGQVSGSSFRETAPYPAVLYAWLSRHPMTPLPDLIQLRWLNNSYGNHLVKIEVVSTPFDRLLHEMIDGPPSSAS
ncbi:hypothetical protein ACIA49_38555 [Kribbella sp. NPDC051587]|uniref:hypothetical protein n=1 Tax=Kribbella sp. NPDC051587 TaxID=3364119 RepID=UPI003792BC34